MALEKQNMVQKIMVYYENFSENTTLWKNYYFHRGYHAILHFQNKKKKSLEKQTMDQLRWKHIKKNYWEIDCFGKFNIVIVSSDITKVCK